MSPINDAVTSLEGMKESRQFFQLLSKKCNDFEYIFLLKKIGKFLNFEEILPDFSQLKVHVSYKL